MSSDVSSTMPTPTPAQGQSDRPHTSHLSLLTYDQPVADKDLVPLTSEGGKQTTQGGDHT